MDNVIDFGAARARPATFAELPDDMRLDLARVMVAVGLEPSDWLDTEVGDICDEVIGAVVDLRERIAATGLVIV
jgi:hypothetical protein